MLGSVEKVRFTKNPYKFVLNKITIRSSVVYPDPVRPVTFWLVRSVFLDIKISKQFLLEVVEFVLDLNINFTRIAQKGLKKNSYAAAFLYRYLLLSFFVSFYLVMFSGSTTLTSTRKVRYLHKIISIRDSDPFESKNYSVQQFLYLKLSVTYWGIDECNTRQKFFEDRFKMNLLCSGSGSVSICFGPSGSVSQRYGSRSGSFYHQAKLVRKTLIPTFFWLLYDFIFRIWIRGADPDLYLLKCHGSTTVVESRFKKRLYVTKKSLTCDT